MLELVEGEPLRGPLDVATALECACQVADAIQAAHEHGIVHRDLKPANIRLTPDGRVKVLDFGVAKATTPVAEPASAPGGTSVGTQAGLIVGTPGYMSPEQARGLEVDQRTDIWAFGCLCFELLAGTRAFAGSSDAETIAAVLEQEPDWGALPGGTPPGVVGLLRRCLTKDAGGRPGSMAEVRAVLEEAQRQPDRLRRALAQLRRPRYAVPAAAILLLLGYTGVRLYQYGSRVRWVRVQAVPEIARLVEAGNYEGASRLLRRADSIVPGDPAVAQVRDRVAMPVTVQTNPAGAEVWATGYRPDDEDWVRLGTTPFTTKLLPIGFYRVRVQKPGFETITASAEVRGGNAVVFDLDPMGSLPPGMVRVPAGIAGVGTLDDVTVGPFAIDRFEVTNRQFKEFVDRGGYRQRRYWRQELRQRRTHPRLERGVQLFRDSTGQPGPSTWSGGEYPSGHDDYPVNGVSWYEAAAYAEFAGKRLPSIYHWQRAASPGWFWEIVQLSNFRGDGPAPVGSFRGLGAYGTLDMAGNVKEWCSNEVAGQRYVRGGAWNQPVWTFVEPDARSPWDRSPENGFRCVRAAARDGSALDAPVTPELTDRRDIEPVPDDVFDLYRSLYSYDSDPPRRAHGARCRGDEGLAAGDGVVCVGGPERTDHGVLLHSQARDAALPGGSLREPRHGAEAPDTGERRGADLRLHRQERAGLPAAGAEGLLPAALHHTARRPERLARPAGGRVEGLPALHRLPGEPRGRGSRAPRRLRREPRRNHRADSRRG